MLKRGILNSELNRRLSLLGHTDLTFIVDAGMPLPVSDTVVDLALVAGVPTFSDVYAAVTGALEVEGATVASEAKGHEASQLWAGLECPVQEVSHEALKAMLGRAKLIVRTGECTPYANLALRSGVPF